MRYGVDFFGKPLIPVIEVTAAAAFGLALLDLEDSKIPRKELILSARVYELDQDGKISKVIGVVRYELEGKDAA